MVFRSRVLGSFKLPLYGKKSSGKGFLTALVCVQSRVQGMVIRQQKLTEAGTAITAVTLSAAPAQAVQVFCLYRCYFCIIKQ